MKKERTGKRILGLLMAVLMIVQLPLTALAENMEAGEFSISEYTEEFIEPTVETAEDDMFSDGTDFMDTENTSDSVIIEEEKILEEDSSYEADTENNDENLESEEQVFENIEEDGFLESVETVDENEEIMLLSDQEELDETEETKDITVTISISKYGQFLNDKNGKPMAGRSIVLTGKASYTMDDALKAAHEQYYQNGTAGYDYHADEAGIYDGIIYKLWGISRDDVPNIKTSLNRDSANFLAALSRTVQDGDEMHFYIQQRSGVDQLAFFTETDQTITMGNDVILRLRNADTSYGHIYSDCEGASIYIDGIKQEGAITDSNGQVTITGLSAREEPYFITAEKIITLADGTKCTAISASYTNVKVLKGNTPDTSSYIRAVSIKTITDAKEVETNVSTLDDGTEVFVIPAEMAYLHYQKKADMYVKVDIDAEIPEDCKVYAVYENPKDGTTVRVQVKNGELVYLKNAIAKGVTYGNMINYNQAIRSIKLEVRQAGEIIETKVIPVRYRNHLSQLIITDSFGNKLETGFQDTLDDQKLVVTVPANAQYIEIESKPYGYIDTNKKITVDGKENELTFYQSYKMLIDWTAHDTYTIALEIIEKGVVYCPETANYEIELVKGDIDYTPTVTLNEKENSRYSILKESASPILKANVEVLNQEEGKISYQWYQCGGWLDSPVIYTAIEGAVQDTYVVPTEKRGNQIGYSCQATYEINNKKYTAMSGSVYYTIIEKEVEVPEIIKQPENILYVKGKPIEEKFTIELEETPWRDLTPKYQWYRSEEANTETGTLINGATEDYYLPSAVEQGTVYYYCKVYYRRWEDNGPNERTSVVDGITNCSNIVSVSEIEEELPWRGNGSSSTPFLLNNLSDLEALRDKVNEDGYSFDGMHFQLTDNIQLSSEWTPIGTIEPSQTLTGNGKYIWAFSGIFDGNGHTVTMADGGKPLFNYVREAVIENLNLAGNNINGYGLVDRYTVDYGVDGNYNTGCPAAVTIRNVTLKSGMSTKKAGLIGGYASGANTVLIENCKAESGVVIGYSRQEGSIGSFAGSINGIIRNCHSAATVYGTSKVGGLVGAKGQSMGACRVENSSFTGTVTASGNWIGGILGSGYEADSAPNTPVASVKNCYVAGNVSGAANVGGIFGGEPSCLQCWGNGSGGISNNFFYGSVSGSSNVGAIVGYLRSFDKFQGISNNYYLDTCGAAQGIGAIGVILSAEGVSQNLPFEYDSKYGIDYVFDQNLYCFAKTASEFADGTVRAGLNSGDYSNWAQGSAYPVYGQGAYATSLTLSGDYKKEYYLGEALDLSGGTFTVTWSNGSKTHPQADEITVIGYDPNKRGSQMLQLKYGAVETTITVSVLLKTGQIEVKFTLYGDSIHDSDSDHNYHTLTKGNLETWIPETTYIVNNNTKVKDVLEQALRENNMTCENASGNYVSAITRNGVKLEEFSNGKYSGWMYTLNGKHPDLGVNEQYLNSGDVIIFHYTDYYVEEEHEHQWSDQWQSNDTAHWHECEYSCGQQKDLAAHSWNAGVITKTATCTQNGVRTYTCSVCGAQKTDKIPAIGHKFGNWSKASDATVFAAEVQKRSCSQCAISETTTVGSKLTAVLELPGKISSFSMKKGKTTALTVTMAGGDSVASVKSSASKTLKASLDQKTGKITLKALKKGSAKLSIKLASGKSKTYTVKVVTGTVKTTGVSVTSVMNKKLTLIKGKTHTLKVEVKPFTSTQKVIYKTSNKKVATVTSSGKIKAVGAGKATITVTSGSKKVKVTVTVPGITGLKSFVTVKRNKTTTLKPKTYGISEKVTYTSSNPKVTTVTKAGKVKGIKKGTAKITVQAGSYKKTVTVKVK